MFWRFDRGWEYLDPNKVKRGPFSRSRMLVWYEHQMLPAVRSPAPQFVRKHINISTNGAEQNVIWKPKKQEKEAQVMP